MTFAAALAEPGLPVALEITPPKTLLRGVLRRRAGLLDDVPTAINVIQRPDRLSSLDASLALMEEGYNPAWHLVIRGRPEAEIVAEVERAAAAGITQVLCIRGDSPAPGVKSPTIKQVVGQISALMPEAAVGATLNQYSGSMEKAAANLMGKIEAGATYVQTQPVFDVGHLEERIAGIRAAAPGLRVVAMAMPLLSVEALKAIETRLRISGGPELEARIAAGEGWAVFEEVMTGLAKSPSVDGVAIMTYEMDPPAETAARLLGALRTTVCHS